MSTRETSILRVFSSFLNRKNLIEGAESCPHRLRTTAATDAYMVHQSVFWNLENTTAENPFFAFAFFQAFEHTTSYDESISRYMRRHLTANGERCIQLRYGTNPHQKEDAELYIIDAQMPLKGAFQHIDIKQRKSSNLHST